jgi:hypothetical protein
MVIEIFDDRRKRRRREEFHLLATIEKLGFLQSCCCCVLGPQFLFFCVKIAVRFVGLIALANLSVV